MIKKTLLTFLILLLSTSGWATIHYVTYSGAGSLNGSSIGNAFSWSGFLSSANWDSNANTENNKIGPGETVYFSGAFPITSTPDAVPGDGASGNYIILDGDDGVNTPVDFYEGGGSPSYLFNFGNAQYFTMRDFEFSGTTAYTDTGILMSGADYINIDSITMLMDATTGIKIAAGSTNINVYDSSIKKYDVTSPSSTGQAILVDGSNTVNIYRNTIDNWGHNQIEGSDDSSNRSISDVNIYENLFQLTTAGYGRAFGFAGDFQGTGTCTNITIRHNYIENQRSPSGFDGCNSTYVYGNVFHTTKNCCEDVTNDGIDAGCTLNYEYCVGPNSSCTGVDQPWGCCTGSGTGDCKDKTYYRSGWILALTSKYRDSGPYYIYNNTFGPSAEAAIQIRAVDSTSLSNVYIRNNIFYNFANAATPSDDPIGSTATFTDRLVHGTVSDGGALSGFYFDNNLVYDLEGIADDIYWGGTYYDTLNDGDEFDTSPPAAVTSVSGNLTDNPDFTDQSNGDYTLTAVSPAIDQGYNLGASYDDCIASGSSWPSSVSYQDQDDHGSGWEIGAYCYTSGGEAPQTKEIEGVICSGCIINQ